MLIISLLSLLDWYYPVSVRDSARYFSRVVLDEHGRVLRSFADENGVWRQKVKLDDVSENYIDAVIGYEDQWFWRHPGINPISFIRAAYQNVKCDCVVSGGSTITMQVARILHPHSRSFSGKLYQVMRAFQLEWHYSKQEILEMYLNFAPFGGTIEGVQAASRSYLEKNANELTDAEAALLAVLPQAPSRLRPDRYPQRATSARNKVLNRLVTEGVWEPVRAREAMKEDVYALAPVRPVSAALLARALVKQYPQQSTIVTTINADLQRSVEEYVSNLRHLLPEKSSVAVLITENSSSSVKAYIGSADFSDKDRFGHVDMVRSIRSPGSTLKPFIYGMAIDEGLIHSHSLLLDAPRQYGEYRPLNFNKHFNGPVSTTFALQKSLNLPAVQVLEVLGPAKFDARLKNAGVPLRYAGDANLSLALGGAGSNLWELVQLYSSIANNGQVSNLNILQSDKKTENDGRYLMSESAAWVVYKMLATAPRPDRIQSSVFHYEDNPIAWKTGTSYGYRDAWAIGTSKDHTIGVWVGRPDGTPQPGHYGAATSAPILFTIFNSMPEQAEEISPPVGINIEEICWPLGKKKALTQAEHCHQKFESWIADQQVPPTLAEFKEGTWRTNPMRIWLASDTKHLIDQGCLVNDKVSRLVAVWPRIIEPWIHYRHRLYGQLPQVDARCRKQPEISVRDLTISNPEMESRFYLTPDTPVFRIYPDTIGGHGSKDWYLNGQFIGTSSDGSNMATNLTEEGEYELSVFDEFGYSDRITMSVYRHYR